MIFDFSYNESSQKNESGAPRQYFLAKPPSHFVDAADEATKPGELWYQSEPKRNPWKVNSKTVHKTPYLQGQVVQETSNWLI